MKKGLKKLDCNRTSSPEFCKQIDSKFRQVASALTAKLWSIFNQLRFICYVIYLFTFICAAITQKKKQESIIMNSYEAQMGILAKR